MASHSDNSVLPVAQRHRKNHERTRAEVADETDARGAQQHSIDGVNSQLRRSECEYVPTHAVYGHRHHRAEVSPEHAQQLRLRLGEG